MKNLLIVQSLAMPLSVRGSTNRVQATLLISAEGVAYVNALIQSVKALGVESGRLEIPNKFFGVVLDEAIFPEVVTQGAQCYAMVSHRVEAYNHNIYKEVSVQFLSNGLNFGILSDSEVSYVSRLIPQTDKGVNDESSTMPSLQTFALQNS